MKTETCKLYSRVFWIFLPNIIKIDSCNFELYHFKAGSLFETQCTSLLCSHIWWINCLLCCRCENSAVVCVQQLSNLAKTKVPLKCCLHTGCRRYHTVPNFATVARPETAPISRCVTRSSVSLRPISSEISGKTSSACDGSSVCLIADICNVIVISNNTICGWVCTTSDRRWQILTRVQIISSVTEIQTGWTLSERVSD